jgi:hypothetical protein
MIHLFSMSRLALGVAVWLVVTPLLLAQEAESLGPSSRRTGLIFSEIMYHPQPDPQERNLEFIELFNTDLIEKDIGGFRLTGSIEYVLPWGTRIPAGGFLVLAAAPADIEAAYGLADVPGGFSQLPRDEGTLQLRNRAGAILLEVNYRDRHPWPEAANGAGPSLVLARPSWGEDHPFAWSASRRVGGSPGGSEPMEVDPLRALCINEFLANPDEGGQDYIELYNRGGVELDISGCLLTDSRTEDKFAIPPGTIIGPRSHWVVHREQLGFGLSSSGERIYLRDPSAMVVLDAVHFEGQAAGISTGRHPDGSPGFQTLEHPTPGEANARRLIPEVVIHELMYHPPSREDRDQFVELHNHGLEPVHLGGWRLTDGIEFEFPVNAEIPAGGYVVVAKDAEWLMGRYAALTSANTFGNFRGRLSFRGERVALVRPLEADGDSLVLVNEVTYQDGGRWPGLADGGGSSLELVDARSDNRLASNWAASHECDKSEWVQVEHTGVLDHGTGTPSSLHILLLGEGECLVDDVEVLTQSGQNLVANSRFESGVTGWAFQGTHHQSGWAPAAGFQSGGALHVRAVARGDTGANRIRTTLSSPLAAGSVATLRARVRWLSGTPDILLRLYGNHLEAEGRLTLPVNLGTPGERNSRAAGNVGPAMTEISHAPVLPAAGQPVRVTARLDDPDGIGLVRLRYRIDPSSTWNELIMRDDGLESDAVPSDGVYTATLPGQSNGTLAAFYLEAEDGAVPAAVNRFPARAPEQECLIRWGDVQPPGQLGTYRAWMTAATHNHWAARGPLDNTPLDVTFVYNEERVIYNAGGMYAGSPHIAPGFNRPTGNLCGYVFLMPKDDRFLGVTDVRLDWPGRDDTALQEQYAYFVARELNLPFSQRRFVHLHVNGVTSTQRGSIYEDSQQVNGDFISSWLPDEEDGQLFKIEQWFEFADNGQRTHTGTPRLGNYTTLDGVKKKARYRWNWLQRAVKNSAHDYEALFALADAANTPPGVGYVSGLESLADLEQWMRIFAVEHIVVNFDSYGSDIGKNMYAYKPTFGRWKMFMWDIDWVMTASAQHGYSPTSPLMYLGPARFGEGNRDPAVARMYEEPQFQRAYWRAVRDAVEGPLRTEIVAPWMDAMHAALVANGVTSSAGRSLAAPHAVKTWIAQRRTYLVDQLEAVAAPFAVTNPSRSSFFAVSSRITLAGTAPIEVHRISVNGIPARVTWSGLNHWTLETLLRSGTHTLRIEGLDLRGDPIPEAMVELTASYQGPDQGPEDYLVINEWMASNESIPHPGDGLFHDWFEIYNPNSVPVDPSDFFLSDDSTHPLQFRIPPGTFIPAQGHLLVWAAGQDAQPGWVNGQLHASFRLSRAGEEILLSAPDGRLLDHVLFGQQSAGISQGRFPDGSPPPFQFFTEPTPGDSNRMDDLPPQIEILAVTFTDQGFVLTWSALPGARYQVQYKDELWDGEWLPLLEEFEAVEPSIDLLDVEALVAPTRFYRILRRPAGN